VRKVTRKILPVMGTTHPTDDGHSKHGGSTITIFINLKPTKEYRWK